MLSYLSLLETPERFAAPHLGDPKQTADARAEEKAVLEKARAKYQAVCLYVLRFLEAELKGGPVVSREPEPAQLERAIMFVPS
jgi:hypothetical protein